MEQLLLPSSNGVYQVPENGSVVSEGATSKVSPFIISNTQEVDFQEVKQKHIIPVFVKDNEPLISHCDFIEAAWEVAAHVYGDGNVSSPSIRVSHPIKGRSPEAKHKRADELTEEEKTLYYERMMFGLEIPCNTATIGGNTLSLFVGGVKAYSEDNLHNKKGVAEHFKAFVGFQNRVCTNLCVSSDGLVADLRVTTMLELHNKLYDMMTNYNAREHLNRLESLPGYQLSEKQFAQLIGRARLYQYLPAEQKKDLPLFTFGDSQINSVCKDYYKDENFCRENDGSISLWKLYNLFTGANKSSYIDGFLNRAANSSSFIHEIARSLDQGKSNWFLN